MFTGLNVFKLAYAMSTHAGQHQAVVAQNIANADTPGYRARKIESFKLDPQPDTGMRANHPGHFSFSDNAGAAWHVYTSDASADPNGNSVSVEQEMLNAVEIKRQHDRALAIYKSSLNLLRTSLGRA